MPLTRRQFVVGSSLTAAYAASGMARIGGLVYGQTAGTNEILVVLYLRGGIDGLNFAAPVNEPNYVALRSNLRLRDSGQNAGLPLANPIGNGIDFRLHPSAQPLLDVYQAGALAIVQAVGLTVANRSHFDAQSLMEGGVPTARQQTGWLTRHITTSGGQGGPLPTVAASNSLPGALQGSSAVAMPNLNNFALPGDPTIFPAMTRMYNGTTALHMAGFNAIQAIQNVNSAIGRPPTGGAIPAYTPENGAVYAQPETQSGSLGAALMTIARLIKLDIGLRIATLDVGGWDTHNNQGLTTGTYATNVDSLARNLLAFYNDMVRYRQRVTLVAMSEFGRTLRENQSGGTDHGRASIMLVLGGSVNGGRMYGQWPGLSNPALDGGDLAVTTDYRQVLAELVVRRLQNPQISTVFPGLGAYHPLGIVQGSDLPTT
ncbi:MAG: DUF1501 domain-containing protein [Chloracidobacterium sp.]|uniref:DUF1501 domain-containing protein n=1 Tax=Chloracidobacterium validum TaxID=2821543 RepID=A0ABX8B8Y1_9BACT|nr:DUF1501 domain-containing protein [Chloracidobacterium validum]QUW03348.1 DUF1501 domain-containing protein [Chloracidobacterium validum]